jgi:hypothetical protein
MLTGVANGCVQFLHLNQDVVVIRGVVLAQHLASHNRLVMLRAASCADEFASCGGSN